jgi:hypothetical protein
LDPANCIEDMCFKSIKFSLDIAVVPIRKFLILFYIYLRLLFGPAPGKNPTSNNFFHQSKLKRNGRTLSFTRSSSCC